jgi:GR25 family glycosyltransferase involved in LPS biosynthesis
MQAFVITLMENHKSIKSSNKTIETAEKHGLKVKQFRAITPKDNPNAMMKERGIATGAFHEEFSRLANCKAAFMSHYSLWEWSVQTNEAVIIFEHDAIIMAPIPNITFDKCITFSKPSYGKYETPTVLGTQPLTQKPYFGGAHGYAVSPEGAQLLMDKAISHAAPTDVFLNLQNFPWLQEYYPWVCMAADRFTTIQKTNGCLAKHNFSRGDYEIINA